MAAKVVYFDKKDAWFIAEDNYCADTAKYYEGLFTQGNGYMDVRGSYEEGLQAAVQDEEYDRKPANVTLEKHRNQVSKWGTYIPGVVGEHPYLKTEIINLPYFFDIKLSVSGETLDMEEGNISQYSRWLNLRDGCLHRSFLWETKSGLVLKLSYQRYISMWDKHLAQQHVTVRAVAGEGTVEVQAGIHAGVRTNGFQHFTEVRKITGEKPYIQMQTATNGGGRVLMLADVAVSGDMKAEQAEEENRVFFRGKGLIKAGGFFTVEKTISVCTDRDLEEGPPDRRGEQYLEQAKRYGSRLLYERHQRAWREKWKDADIMITGDDRSQLALRASIYHLLRANNEDDPRVAICAKGYAGEAYCGRYFWDTEINMLPFFLHTNPKAAKNLLLFRYHTLAGAKRNAEAYGYEGARYPWESSIAGDEECACWQYADHEIHITADIVYAMIHYARATGDMEFIYTKAIDVMVETARYWVQRVDQSRDGSYELLGVMGPDEYLPITRNNAYTNKMVSFSLEQTVYFLRALQERDSVEYEKLTRRLRLGAEELARFEEVKERLKIPFDKNTLIISQSDDFESYADLDFDAIWKDRTRCFGEFISQEKNYRSKALKQADVLEMLLLYPNEFTEKQLRENYDYYEPLTTHDSSLSAAVHGILASWMGRMEEAGRFLDKVIRIDMDPDKKGAEEGIHIANCGGLWQLVVYGFAGLSSAMWEDEIRLRPHLPRQWERLEIPLYWHGARKKLIITHKGSEICDAESEYKGAIFDLDGVLVDTARYHYQAWSMLARRLGFVFTPEDNERLKGVSRRQSLEFLLEVGGVQATEEEKQSWMQEKNEHYVQMIQRIEKEELLEGAEEYLKQLRKRGIKTALGSASKNAATILERLGIAGLFDAIIDGNQVTNSKPDPEVFLKAADALGLQPGECVVFEDAAAGIEAAHNAGITAVGIGGREALREADYVVESLLEMISKPV